jgi:hypothetical protein
VRQTIAMPTALRIAGLAFGLLAAISGVLQLWAFGAGGGTRHLILGVFACAVGACVVVAAARRGRD